eukprot:95008_1
MSDSDNDSYEDAEPIGPLATSSKVTHKITMDYVPKPKYAESTASSAIGHATYFDQLQSANKSDTRDDMDESKCNRIFSYFNLLDLILQCIVFGILSVQLYFIYMTCSSDYKVNGTHDSCSGQLDECKEDNRCTYSPSNCTCKPSFNLHVSLMIMYILLTVLVLLYMLCRSCMICCMLRKGSKNKNLFVSGRVMHQSWMNSIADDCWIALCCCWGSRCCNNMTRVAYIAAIDQYKAFPTKTALIVNNLVKILNISFCAVQIYIGPLMTPFMFIMATVGVLFVCTFIVTMCRMRSKRNTEMIKQALQISPRMSPISSSTR